MDGGVGCGPVWVVAGRVVAEGVAMVRGSEGLSGTAMTGLGAIVLLQGTVPSGGLFARGSVTWRWWGGGGVKSVFGEAEH